MESSVCGCENAGTEHGCMIYVVKKNYEWYIVLPLSFSFATEEERKEKVLHIQNQTPYYTSTSRPTYITLTYLCAMNNRIKLLFQNPFLHYVPSCLLYLQIGIKTNIRYGHAVGP